MNALFHQPSDDMTFEWIELPVGPRPLPAWVKGAKVHWMPGYANAPDFLIKVPRTWGGEFLRGEPYREERPGVFIARTEDGRLHQYEHHGAVTMTKLKRFVGVVDGKMQYEEFEQLATTQQEGFGGDNYNLDVIRGDGRAEKVMLRGPWHSGRPEGFVECATSNSAGITVSDDLFLRIVARFMPWHRVARVHRYGFGRLQLVHSDWDAPKLFLPNNHPVRRYGVPGPYSGYQG